MFPFAMLCTTSKTIRGFKFSQSSGCDIFSIARSATHSDQRAAFDPSVEHRPLPLRQAPFRHSEKFIVEARFRCQALRMRFDLL